jgi:acyl-coenzyme A thioesterase PaaI-like protein
MQIMQNTTYVAASTEQGTVVYEIDIKDSFCITLGPIHSGAVSTILDRLMSFGLYMYAKPGFMKNDTLTRTLTVTCLRPVLAGTKLRVEAELVSIGKTMGNVKGFYPRRWMRRHARLVDLSAHKYHLFANKNAPRLAPLLDGTSHTKQRRSTK